MRGVIVAATVALAGSAWSQTIGPQVRVDPNAVRGAAANETTASASERDPMRVVAGWNDWRESGGGEIIRAAFSLTFDGGQTWNDFVIRPPQGFRTSVEGDPMTAFDDRTGTLWAGAIAFGSGGMYVARLDPGKTTFNDSVMATQRSSEDKCWMAAGPIPGNPDSTRLYIAYNRGVIWSDDMGDTWNTPRSLGNGIGFLPRVGPNGELYIAYWDFGTGVMLKRSLNGGQTFDTIRMATRLDTWGTQEGSRFPGNMRVPPLNYIDVAPNGTLYCVYFDTTNRNGNNYNVDLYFTRSTNRGDTWSPPKVINRDGGNPPGDQFFPWVEVDRTGRIHVTWYDGRHTDQNDSLSSPTNGFFDNYYAYSDDMGNTWTEHRLTPRPWNCNDDGLNRSQQFIGDYNAMAVAGNRVYPVYLDSTPGDPDIFTNVIVFPEPCYPDFDGNGVLDIRDFFAFQAAYAAGDRRADCDANGTLDIRDFFCFQSKFAAGCP